MHVTLLSYRLHHVLICMPVVCRELHERLRSLVGGAITRMAREKACKSQIADLESQLHLLKVRCPTQSHIVVPMRRARCPKTFHFSKSCRA